MTKRMTMICLTLALSAARAEETAKVFPAAPVRALDVQTEGGDVRVYGEDAKEIKVTVLKGDPAKCDITMEQTGDVLRLKAKRKSKLSWGDGCEAGFQVQAPKSVALDAASGSGDMRVYELTGNLKVRLGSGNFEGNARSKQADLKCGSGSVRLTGLLGSADVKVGSGDVDLRWAEAPTTGEVDVKSGSGDVALLFPEGVKLETDILTGSGNVHNEIGDTASAKFRVVVKAGSGDVKIGKRPSRG